MIRLFRRQPSSSSSSPAPGLPIEPELDLREAARALSHHRHGRDRAKFRETANRIRADLRAKGHDLPPIDWDLLMQISLLKPAPAWRDQTLEERLRLCAEALCVHDLIEPKERSRILAELEARAELARRARDAAQGILARD